MQTRTKLKLAGIVAMLALAAGALTGCAAAAPAGKPDPVRLSPTTSAPVSTSGMTCASFTATAAANRFTYGGTYISAEEARLGHENDYASLVWCRQPSATTAMTAAQQLAFSTAGVAGAAKLLATHGAKSPAFHPVANAYSNATRVQKENLVAWTACTWTGSKWTVQPAFKRTWDGFPYIFPEDCRDWWSGSNPGSLGAFNVGDGSDVFSPDVESRTRDWGVVDFMHALAIRQ